MIVLFTDFGVTGPFVGQMHAKLAQQAPGVPVIDLLHDVPAHDVRAGAYLLPACTQGFPVDSVFICVVDPGVGTDRAALALRADDRWYVGPDNGLLAITAQRARSVHWFEIRWRPANLSASFHGRDLFAPVAAMLARGASPELSPGQPHTVPDWPDDLLAAIYVDRYGNVMTGLRALRTSRNSVVRIAGHELRHARTYGEVGTGEAFWYENSIGLVELAVNGGRADSVLGIGLGDPIDVH